MQPFGTMLKKLLISLGLAKAPAPIGTYFKVSPFVGAPLALAYIAWKYRDKIGPMLRRAQHVLPSHQDTETTGAQPA